MLARRKDRRGFDEEEIWQVLVQGVAVLCLLQQYSLVHGRISEHTLSLGEDFRLQLLGMHNALSALDLAAVSLSDPPLK